MKSVIQKVISKILLFTVVATFVFGSVFAVQPIKQAEAANILPGGAAASAPISVPSFSWYEFAKDTFTEIMLGVAYQMASNFLSKFVNKLTEKYKIRNFLYYDQVLTNYYLTNFIRDKISDPDLRQIYILLEAGYITGQPTGLSNAPNPREALVPRLKLAINEVYKKQTGIDPAIIANPPENMSTRDYLSQAQYFYLNHPGYVETNLRHQFGAYQSAATTAAQLEILVGNSLKAGRFIGGTCSVTLPFIPVRNGFPDQAPDQQVDPPTIPGGTSYDAGNSLGPIAKFLNKIGLVKTASAQAGGGSIDPTTSPENCALAGGVWQKSSLDQARSFIDNPTAYVDSWLLSGINEIAGNNFKADNFWFVIGNHLGNFLYKNLFLDKAQGVLHEDPRGYTPENYNSTNSGPQGIDVDSDGIPDGYDIDNDGIADSCVYGGTAPGCTGSASVGSVDPGTGSGGFIDCGVPPLATSPDPTGVANAVRAEFADLDLMDANDRDYFTAIVAYRLWQQDPNWGRKKAGPSNPVSEDTLGYLRADVGPGRFEAVDILSGSTGAIQRGCFGLVDAGQVWVQPEPAP